MAKKNYEEENNKFIKQISGNGYYNLNRQSSLAAFGGQSEKQNNDFYLQISNLIENANKNDGPRNGPASLREDGRFPTTSSGQSLDDYDFNIHDKSKFDIDILISLLKTKYKLMDISCSEWIKIKNGQQKIIVTLSSNTNPKTNKNINIIKHENFE
jgi:hypothetical protein